MKKTLILMLVSVIIFSTGSSAQKFEIGFTTGYSSFRMKSMKENLENIRNSLPSEAKIVSNYPPRISFGGYFTATLRFGYSIGVEYFFNSTGSKIAYSDYSGEYSYNETLINHSIGIINGFRFLTLGNFGADGRLSLDFDFSRIKQEETLNVSDSTSSSVGRYKSTGFSVVPSIQLSYSLPFMKFGADVGYLFDAGGSIHSAQGKFTQILPDWSGLRIGINIGVFLDKLFGSDS